MRHVILILAIFLDRVLYHSGLVNASFTHALYHFKNLSAKDAGMF